MYLLERGATDLVELTTWAQQYLTAHKQQPGGKSKTTVQPRREDQKKPTQSKPDSSEGRHSATVFKVMDTDNQNVLQRL